MASALDKLRDPSEKTLAVLLLAPAFALLALIVAFFASAFILVQRSAVSAACLTIASQQALLVQRVRFFAQELVVAAAAETYGTVAGACGQV